jgi:hypothetical protein
MVKDLLGSDAYWAPFRSQSRMEYRAHVEMLRSILLEVANEKIPEKWKRDAFARAIKFDDNSIELDDTDKLAMRIENGDPDQRGRDMRTYNWRWKTDGKGRRYVDVRMDRNMKQVEAFAMQAGTGKHPGAAEGLSLMDFLRQGVKAHMSVNMPGGATRTVQIGSAEGRSRVPPKTVQKINERLHVSDPFAAGRMLAASYSGSGGTQMTGLRIWRRMWADQGNGVTWMAQAWKGADVFRTAENSSVWKEEIDHFVQRKKQIINDAVVQALQGG